MLHLFSFGFFFFFAHFGGSVFQFAIDKSMCVSIHGGWNEPFNRIFVYECLFGKEHLNTLSLYLLHRQHWLLILVFWLLNAKENVAM